MKEGGKSETVLEVKDFHKRFGRHHVLKEEVIRPLNPLSIFTPLE